MNFLAMLAVVALLAIYDASGWTTEKVTGKSAPTRPIPLATYGSEDDSKNYGATKSNEADGAYDLNDDHSGGNSNSGTLGINNGGNGALNDEPEAYSDVKSQNEGSSSNHNAYDDQITGSIRPQRQAYNANFARPIVIKQQGPQSIDGIYNLRSPKYEQLKNVLSYINYERDFPKYNAFSNKSEFQWLNAETDNQADHAFFVFPGEISAYGGIDDEAYGNKDNTNEVILVTKPFTNYLPNNNPIAYTSYYEGCEVRKNPLNVQPNDTSRYLFRTKCGCKLLNMDKHPFPRYLVTNENDDPRLGSCAFGFYDVDSNIFAYFQVTNEGVWAVYESQANLHFFSRRRVASRSSYDDVVDGGVEYDALLNAISWYINGQNVWTVYGIGFPPPQDGLTSVDLGQGSVELVRLTNIREGWATLKHLDQKDPNNPQSSTRLVKTQPSSSSTYGPNDKFYDSYSLRSNNLWGQAAEFSLYKLLVIKADQKSVSDQATTRPYGAL